MDSYRYHRFTSAVIFLLKILISVEVTSSRDVEAG